jgi:hypothetical protein
LTVTLNLSVDAALVTGRHPDQFCLDRSDRPPVRVSDRCPSTKTPSTKTSGIGLQFFNTSDELSHDIAGAAKQHHGFVFKEQFIFNSGKPFAHAPFDHDRVLGLIDF